MISPEKLKHIDYRGYPQPAPRGSSEVLERDMEKLFVVETQIVTLNGKPLLGYCGHGETDQERYGSRMPKSAVLENLVVYKVLETEHETSRFRGFQDGHAIFGRSSRGMWKHKIVREENGVYVLDPRRLSVVSDPTQSPA